MPPRARKVPGKREDIEEFLDGKSVKYTFRTDVPVSEFDLEKSLKNQARINTVINEAQVETYVDAMKRGDDFPAVIAYLANGKLIAVDGNHRLQAAKIVGKQVSVYVLDAKTDPQTIVHLTFEANTKHGLPNSIDERVRHGIYMLANGATSQAAVAQRINVPLATLQRAWTKKVADDRADEVGLIRREWDALNPSSRMRLKAIHTDEGFAAMADLAIRAALDASEVDLCVTQLNKVKSSAGQKKIVEDFTSQFRSRIQKSGSGIKAKKPRVNSPRHALAMAFGQIRWAYERKDSLPELVAPAEQEAFIKEMEQVAEDILGLVDLLKSAGK